MPLTCPHFTEHHGVCSILALLRHFVRRVLRLWMCNCERLRLRAGQRHTLEHSLGAYVAVVVEEYDGEFRKGGPLHGEWDVLRG